MKYNKSVVGSTMRNTGDGRSGGWAGQTGGLKLDNRSEAARAEAQEKEKEAKGASERHFVHLTEQEAKEASGFYLPRFTEQEAKKAREMG